MQEFKTIEGNFTAEIEEKRSKFIANLFYVETVEEAEELIKKTKQKYYDARHNCYAYIIQDNIITKKSSDDGEPSRNRRFSYIKCFRKKRTYECSCNSNKVFWRNFTRSRRIGKSVHRGNS